MDYKFKLGDRVIVIDNGIASSSRHYIGKKGIVIEYDNTSVKLKLNDYEKDGWFMNRLVEIDNTPIYNIEEIENNLNKLEEKYKT